MRSHWYTREKYHWDNIAREHDRKNRTEQRISSPEGFLFAQGRYPTKIKELPSYFIPCYIHHQMGWIDTKNIKDLLYKPNLYVNHAFKDDRLYISYSQKIVAAPDRLTEYTGYDEIIWGHDIVFIVMAAKTNAGYDTSIIEQQILDKMKWFKVEYPEEYEREGGKQAVEMLGGIEGARK